MPWIGSFPWSALTERGPAGGRATRCASDLHGQRKDAVGGNAPMRDRCGGNGEHDPVADLEPIHEPPLATLERRCGGCYRLGCFCDPLRDVKLSTKAPGSGALIMASDKLCQSIQAPRLPASEAMTNRVVHIPAGACGTRKGVFQKRIGPPARPNSLLRRDGLSS